MDWLRSHFGNNIISHRSEFPWPLTSPDLRLPINIAHQIFVLPYTSLHFSPIFPYIYLYFPTFPYTSLYIPTFHTQWTLLAKASYKYHPLNICSPLYSPILFSDISLHFPCDISFLLRLPHKYQPSNICSSLYFPIHSPTFLPHISYAIGASCQDSP